MSHSDLKKINRTLSEAIKSLKTSPLLKYPTDPWTGQGADNAIESPQSKGGGGPDSRMLWKKYFKRDTKVQNAIVSLKTAMRSVADELWTEAGAYAINDKLLAISVELANDLFGDGEPSYDEEEEEQEPQGTQDTDVRRPWMRGPRDTD